MHLGAFSLERRQLFLVQDRFGRLHEGLHALLGAAVLVTLLDERIHLCLLFRREVQLAERRRVHFRARRATCMVLVFVPGERGSHRKRRRRHQCYRSKFSHDARLRQRAGLVVQILAVQDARTFFSTNWADCEGFRA